MRRIWDSTTGQPLLTLKGHTDQVSAVAFSPDGTRLVTGSFDDTARIWETTRRRDTLTLRGHTGAVVDIALSPGGDKIVSAGTDGALRLWNTITGSSLGVITSERSPFTATAYSDDGKYIAAGAADGTVQIIEADVPRNRKTVKIGAGGVTSLAFAPKSSALCVSIAAQNTKDPSGNGLYLLTVPDGVVHRTLSKGQPMVVSLAYSRDGAKIVTGGADNVVRIIDGNNGRMLREWRSNTTSDLQTSSYVASVCFSHDGSRVAAAEADQTGSGDNTARVYDVHSGNLALVLKGHANSLYSVAFSPDDSRIITGSADKTARLWDSVTGREVLTLKGHDNVVLCCRFTPNGNRIVTSSADDTIKVWERAPDVASPGKSSVAIAR